MRGIDETIAEERRAEVSRYLRAWIVVAFLMSIPVWVLIGAMLLGGG